MEFKCTIVDSSKSGVFYSDEVANVLNLNALIKRKDLDRMFIKNTISLFGVDTINLSNLATLCVKLKIGYGSANCLKLLESIVKTIKSVDSGIKFTQLGHENELEIDSQPLTYLFSKRRINDTQGELLIQRQVINMMKLMGYTDTQITKLFEKLSDATQIIPSDLMSVLPCRSEKTLLAYQRIKEIMGC